MNLVSKMYIGKLDTQGSCSSYGGHLQAEFPLPLGDPSLLALKAFT